MKFAPATMLLLAASFAFHGPGGPAPAHDWPQWMGPDRDGVWREEGIVERFPEGGPPVVWRAEVGPGYSGPAVADGRVFVLDFLRSKDERGEFLPPVDGAIEGQERLLCFDAARGELLWKQEFPRGYRVQYPSGPRSTPTVVGERVYVQGTMGDVSCHDVGDGRLVWTRNWQRDFEAPIPVWGWSAHPLIVDELLIGLAGGPDAAVVALDARTGETVWKRFTAEEIGYSGPLVVHHGGKKQLIVWLEKEVHGLDPKTGEPYWSHPHPEDQKLQRPITHIISPAWSAPWLLVSEHYQGSLMLRLDVGAPRADVQWRTDPRDRKGLHGYLGTPVMRDGLLFGFSGDGILRCLRIETGETLWETPKPIAPRRQQFASAYIIPQGERYFIFNDQGELVLAQLSESGYEELDRAKLIEPTSFGRGRTVDWAHPAFANRCVFVRNDREILCVSLAEKDAG